MFVQLTGIGDCVMGYRIPYGGREDIGNNTSLAKGNSVFVKMPCVHKAYYM